jgi:phosphopantothenoylcysteine decarboxylase/phosphopantothenate--cysteine ligase
MNILVTAGPTREPLDPVRFISNRSSGKMGYEIARSARARGHAVRLVSGPVSLPVPDGVDCVRVTTAEEMCRAVQAGVPWCEALIMVAAVADWRPVRVSPVKVKKSTAAPVVHLERTPDILETVRPLKGGRIFVGFAAETDHVLEEAGRKLAQKGLDMIVANDVSAPNAGFEVDTNRVVFLTAAAPPRALPLLPKREVADELLRWLEQAAAAAKTEKTPSA